MNSGEGFANTAPIYEGYFLPRSLAYYAHGWFGLRYYFMKILNKGGFSFTTMDELESVCDIMKLCYIVLDFEEEMAIVVSSSS
ncbi:hypothetical protein U0070_013084 [Myodes glareolus]|uniref:Uncharacterized protein n=1 Tax=Myodes glareolus TaxID=447135 RepID=A0AAW0HEE0_MYOGA